MSDLEREPVSELFSILTQLSEYDARALVSIARFDNTTTPEDPSEPIPEYIVTLRQEQRNGIYPMIKGRGTDMSVELLERAVELLRPLVVDVAYPDSDR